MCSLISLAPCLTSATATQMIHATVVSMRPMLRCLWGRMFSLISAYTFFPQDQKTLERLLSQLIAARLLAPPRKEDRR